MGNDEEERWPRCPQVRLSLSFLSRLDSFSLSFSFYLPGLFKSIPKLIYWWTEKLKKNQDGAVIHIYHHVLRKALYTLSLFSQAIIFAKRVCFLTCRFVEIMAPVFSREAWRCVWHMIQVFVYLKNLCQPFTLISIVSRPVSSYFHMTIIWHWWIYFGFWLSY